MSVYNEIHSEARRYCDFFDRDECKRIDARIDAIEKVYNKFLESYGLGSASVPNDYVRLDRAVLSVAVLDYFVDIKRLKEFHKSILRVNEDKIIAYECCWILKRKPLQLLQNDLNLVHINEKFVAEIILQHLLGDFEDACKYNELKEFYQLLLYHLIYRSVDPKTLELMIVAFKTARQVFEPVDKESEKSSVL